MTILATLLTLADSRLPTGGHVHSGGIEEAVTSGLVVDVATLRAYLRRRIRTHGLVAASMAGGAHANSNSSRLSSMASCAGSDRMSRPSWPSAWTGSTGSSCPQSGGRTLPW